jgi:signal transduction histidine kinase
MQTHSLQAIANLQPGDHLCCIYQSEDEHRAVLAPFLRQGLERGEKVIYIADTNTAQTILGYLHQNSGSVLDVEACLDHGQLLILTHQDAYTRGGVFDPLTMITLLRKEMEQALAEGYPALRATGEMTWALRDVPGSERLIEYETRLNRFLPGSQCATICQYDRRRFPAKLLLDVLRTHPIAMIGTEVYGNSYYIPPDTLLSGDPAEIELECWIRSLAERQQAEHTLQESETRIQNAQLLDSLQRSNQELEVHRASLEETVAQRTNELNERVSETEQLNRALVNLLEDLQISNRSLERATQQIKQANEELESFSYSVSHDLRAPLRAIDGFSHILQAECASGLSPNAQRYLSTVRDNAQQMGQLIDDLLAFSRLSRKPLAKQSVSPADLVRQGLEDLQFEQEGRQVEIIIGDLPECQADPSLLKQVYVNLLSNALKYTREREMTRIEIGSLGTEDFGWQTADLEEPQSEISGLESPIYFVKDNGVGFDMRYADKLFDVFQRLHRAEDYEGTGVGLAIVQRIIHRHGGRVWAEAEMDKGTTFYFTI